MTCDGSYEFGAVRKRERERREKVSVSDRVGDSDVSSPGTRIRKRQGLIDVTPSMR